MTLSYLNYAAGTGPDTTSAHAGGLFRIRIAGVKGVDYSQAFLG